MEQSSTDAPGENSLRYEGWRVAAASGLGVFLASIFVYTFAILLRPLSEEFAWSREAVSSAYGITAVMSAASSAPLGYLFDRLGPRRIVIHCLTWLGCAFASLCLLTPHLWHLYATFAVLGVVGTGLSPIAYARAVSSWFERRRGAALALAISGGALGGVVHPPAAQALIRIFGWRIACLTLGGLVLVLGLPILGRFIRERPSARSEGHGVDTRATAASVREGLRSRVFWILVVVLFSSSIAQNGAIVHLVALLTDRGISATRGAMALSAMGGASVVGRLLTGWLVDRFFAAHVSFALLAIASMGVYLLSGAQSFTVGVLAAVLIGFGVGGESNVAPYLLSRYFGLRSFSTLYGFTYIATALAGATGPTLMGRAFDGTGSYEAVLVRIAAGMLCVAALMLAMPRYDSLPVSAAAMPQR